MAQVIGQPTKIEACGSKAKINTEFIGRVNSKTEQTSIAQMESPQRWEEPVQTPEFDEFTVVLDGALHVNTRTEECEVKGGQAVIAFKGEWIQYSSPHEGGAKYIAVCLPAFSLERVHWDVQREN